MQFYIIRLPTKFKENISKYQFFNIYLLMSNIDVDDWYWTSNRKSDKPTDEEWMTQWKKDRKKREIEWQKSLDKEKRTKETKEEKRKRKKKEAKEKEQQRIQVDGTRIDNVSKMTVFHDQKDQDQSQSSKNQDDYVLQRLFAKTGHTPITYY